MPSLHARNLKLDVRPTGARSFNNDVHGRAPAATTTPLTEQVHISVIDRSQSLCDAGSFPADQVS